MANIHVFADESGNFDFTPTGTRFFILTTVSFFDDRQACTDLQDLRYALAWEGTPHPGAFHATKEEQHIRDRVFGAIRGHGFRVDSTVFEKAKAQPQLRESDERFYKYAWFYHMKHVAPKIAQPGDSMLVVAASLGTKKKEGAFHKGVVEVMRQVTPTVDTRTTHWPAAVDTGLQIADYCCWAQQRKWEQGDDRSHVLIRDNIRSEFDVFRTGRTLYY